MSVLRRGRVATLVGALIVALSATLAHGWSDEAHRVTGLIAQDLLTPRARLAVKELLDGGDIADATNYLDIYREALKRELPGSERWHYDNQPVCVSSKVDATPPRYSEYCPDGHCASAQVSPWLNVLADTSNPKAQRQLALRMLLHIVGDLHQPMHAATDNDLGGNQKMMLMPGVTTLRNLHLVWDIDLPKIAMRGLTEQQVAKDLIANHKPKFAKWMRGDARLWIAQSYGIAKRLAYGKLPGFSCGEIDGKSTGLREGKPWTEEPLPLPREYVEGAVAVIPILLAQAGARIGGLLNAALDADGAKNAARPAATVPVKPAAPPTTSLRDALSRPLANPGAPK